MKILNGLSNGQVLQRLGARGATVKLGVDSEGASGAVHLTISGRGGPLKRWEKRLVGRTSGGSSVIELTNIPAGGPYRLDLECGGKKARIASFFVGDVWLMAGQSNMEGAGHISGAAKPHPLIRAFSMRREWRMATEPLHVLNESPDLCHNEGLQQSSEEGEQYRARAAKGTGVGLYFAREMFERSGVPQALISTAHGSTGMQQWDPALKDQGGNSFYGSMVLSVQATGQPLAGVLWYQGENDTSASGAPQYTERMKTLVAATRRDFHQPALPWIIVQLGRVFGPRDDFAFWNSVQDQQRLLPGVIKNLETVAAIDLALDDAIHLSGTSFPRLGDRMARAADFLVYKNKKETAPPRLREVNAGGSSQAPDALSGAGIDVIFDHVGKGLQAGSEPQGFTLLTPEGRVWPQLFKTTLHGHIARLHLGAKLIEGAQLRYGYGPAPVCNITDSRGHALPVFGPIACQKPAAYLPFVTAWKRTGVVQGKKPLKEITCPKAEVWDATPKTYPDAGFVEDHADWLGHPGLAYFWARLELSEPMKLDFLMGFDGPFRLWLNGKPFFDALDGTNPCLPDEASKVAALKAGSHQITVGMDTNGGRAWGFFLRFCRRDISPAAVANGDYVKPAYCL